MPLFQRSSRFPPCPKILINCFIAAFSFRRLYPARSLAERKRQLQAEFDADMARIARGSFFLGSLLEHLAWPTLIAAMAFLAWCIALRLNPQRLGGFDPKLFPWLAASGVFLVAGLVQAFPRQWKALRFW